MYHKLIGLDLAKTVFHCVMINRQGKLIERKKLNRARLIRYISQLEPTCIAMEACATAHYWGRRFSEWGHEVKLLPPKHVKAYLRGQKNDDNDARAIAEACLHGSVRAVPIKTVEQQDDQAFHRIRQQRIKEVTALSNQLRGLLAEYGLVIPRGKRALREALPRLLEDANNELSSKGRQLIHQEYQRLLLLDQDVKAFDEPLKAQLRDDPVCQRLGELPGIGAVGASALKGWMGNGRQFRHGRDASAALGVVPRQYSTGGKQRLYGITKCGDRYTRSVVIHGARAVVRVAAQKSDPLSRWVMDLVARRGYNKAVVALANKLVRIAWVIIARGERYQPAYG